jgi:hypothetical protein
MVSTVYGSAIAVVTLLFMIWPNIPGAYFPIMLDSVYLIGSSSKPAVSRHFLETTRVCEPYGPVIPAACIAMLHEGSDEYAHTPCVVYVYLSEP